MHPIIILKTEGAIKNTPATALYAYQNGKCFYCGKYMRYVTHHPHQAHRKHGYTLDHLFPRSLGYGLAGNCVLAHRKCNELKANRMPTPQEIVRGWELYSRMDRPFIATIVFPS